MAEPLQVGAKAALFVGVVMLLGAGVFARWIAVPPLSPTMRGRLWVGVLLGALLVVCGSAMEVVDTITRAAGAFDASLAGSYLLETRHGDAVIARFALVLVLVVTGGPRARPGMGNAALFAIPAVGLLLTVTLVSHAGAQGAVVPILADLVHVAGVAAWAGSLVYAAWLLAWPARGTTSEQSAMSILRLSTFATVALTLVVISGVYSAVVRLPDVGALTRTPYGRSLLIKIAAVTAVVIVAAVNRWVAIPWMTRGITIVPLRRLVRAESLLVLAVLSLTGVLVSQPLPESPATVAGALQFGSTTGPWVVRGTVAGRGADGFSIAVRMQDAQGAPAPASVPVDLQLTMTDMVMSPQTGRLPRVGPGHYRATYRLPMTGRWQLTVRTPGSVVNVVIPTQQTPAPPARIRWTVAAPALAAVVAGAWLAVTGLRRLGAGTPQAVQPLVAGAALAVAGAATLVGAFAHHGLL